VSESELRYKAHCLKQEVALFTKKPILLLGCGTQFGKTTVGALRMKMKIHQSVNPEDAFIITSPTYKTMTQSTLPPFLKVMKGYGVHDKKNDTFKINGGGTVYLRTETDPDSIVGITNVRHIWGDEAGKYRLYFWENMQARADFCGCGIDLTTSPYALNWVWRELIKPFRQGKRPDVEYISAASWENPYHSLYDPTKREAKRATMDTRRFDMLYGGEFGKMAGLVYDCFDEDENQCEVIPLPPDTKFFAGVDWGFTDPFVIKVRAITPTGNHFSVSEFYKSGLTLSKQVEAARQMARIWNIKMFYCDPSQPGSIEEFQTNGLPAVGADNDIRRGLDAHYELLKTRRLKYFRDKNPHSIDEIETYHYGEPEDLGPDDKQVEALPIDQHNHACDADRYVSISTHRLSGAKVSPKVPDEMRDHDRDDTAKRIARILKPVKNYD
jgi:hypothetical protein